MFFAFNTVERSWRSQISDQKKQRQIRSRRQIPDYSELSEKETIDKNVGTLKKFFKEKYDKMEDSLKWKLKCTGHVVEDVLYECISDFTSEQ